MGLIRNPLASLVAIVFFLSGCASVPIQFGKETSVAVWEFEDLSPPGSVQSDLGELLSARVIQTLSEGEGYTVVERDRLVLALEELRLGTESFADESTGLRIGRLIGAQMMVFGGYQVIEDKMRLDLRLVEVETGRILKAAQRTTSSSDLSGWLKAAKEAADELF